MQTIDASKSIEEVHEEIKSIATTIIENIKDEEIGRLWVNNETMRPAKRPCPEGAVDRPQLNGEFVSHAVSEERSYLFSVRLRVSAVGCLFAFLISKSSLDFKNSKTKM